MQGPDRERIRWTEHADSGESCKVQGCRIRWTEHVNSDGWSGTLFQIFGYFFILFDSLVVWAVFETTKRGRRKIKTRKQDEKNKKLRRSEKNKKNNSKKNNKTRISRRPQRR